MVVDDSAVIRGLLTRTLESDPELSVVVTAGNGQMAVNALQRSAVEIIVLDIEMPVMDGLTALPQLLAACPGVKIVIASTMTRRGADISLRAMAAGAADYITKPGAAALTSAEEFKRELIGKVKALAQAARRARGGPAPRPAIVEERLPLRPAAAPLKAALRPLPEQLPEALAIGASTGGPQALFKLLTALAGGPAQPIFITQHMPATFTTILAEHIQRASGWPAAEAVDGERVRGGRVYVAPGDFHMTIESGEGGDRLIRLSKAPPENYCRPAVDPMLRSLAKVYGSRLLGAMLTGMGHDGLEGGKAVIAAGGAILAQDEATSVVWGMPGAVAHAGLCSAVLPLDELGGLIRRLATRSRA